MIGGPPTLFIKMVPDEEYDLYEFWAQGPNGLELLAAAYRPDNISLLWVAPVPPPEAMFYLHTHLVTYLHSQN